MMKHPAKIDVAVLLLFFNRPESFGQVFAEVKKARPSRLFLYQDGPRGERDMAGIKACNYEFHLHKPSYTWNTLQHLSKDYPDREFVLLIGGDNWAHFERWRHCKDILRNCRVAVYPLDGFPGTMDVPLLPVSSTDIRQRVK